MIAPVSQPAPVELSDEAIEALARLMLESAARKLARKPPQPADDPDE